MKNLTKINILLASFLSTSIFIYFKQNPDFKLFKRDTSNLEVGIHQGHAYIKEVNGKLMYLPILNKEKDLEIIWSTDRQELYLLRRNIKGISQIYLVNPVTKKIKQKTLPLRPKSHLQAVSEQRVSFQSGNEILIFSFKTNKMESILPPLFIDQTSKSRHSIYAFYHQLEGQLLDYKIDPELKQIQFKWKDPFNNIDSYIQELTVSNNIIPLPKKY